MRRVYTVDLLAEIAEIEDEATLDIKLLSQKLTLHFQYLGATDGDVLSPPEFPY